METTVLLVTAAAGGGLENDALKDMGIENGMKLHESNWNFSWLGEGFESCLDHFILHK
jgi:hypothetical protein